MLGSIVLSTRVPGSIERWVPVDPGFWEVFFGDTINPVGGYGEFFEIPSSQTIGQTSKEKEAYSMAKEKSSVPCACGARLHHTFP